MKILFVIPKNKSLFGNEGITAHPHIGIAYLSAFLKRKGIDVAVFDDGIEQEANGIFKIIDNFKPNLIGITIFSYCYGYAYGLIKSIKSGCRIPVILGGPHVSAVKAKVLQDTGADFAIKQEGEFTLIDLLQIINNSSTDFHRVKGLIWRDGENIIENPDRPYIRNLDILPFPDYEVFPIEKYVCYKQKSLPLITSRGCPFGCNYCSVRLSMGQGFRARSAENVFSEIEYFYDHGWLSFDINDDCFTVDKQRAEKICDMIIDNKLNIRFQLYNGIRVDTVTSHLLKKMKQAGCYFISYGCEAGNERILKIIKKNITLQQVRDALNWTNEAGIRNSVNFIIGHTQETYEDALDTINFAKSLPTDFVNFYNLLPYPGTEAYQWARQYANLLVPPESYLEYISYRDNEPIFETAGFTREQRKKIIALGFNLYKKTILTFRLGKILGNLVYCITKYKILDKLATDFALNNLLGRYIYILLSAKSFRPKEKIAI